MIIGWNLYRTHIHGNFLLNGRKGNAHGPSSGDLITLKCYNSFFDQLQDQHSTFQNNGVTTQRQMFLNRSVVIDGLLIMLISCLGLSSE